MQMLPLHLLVRSPLAAGLSERRSIRLSWPFITCSNKALSTMAACSCFSSLSVYGVLRGQSKVCKVCKVGVKKTPSLNTAVFWSLDWRQNDGIGKTMVKGVIPNHTALYV